MNRSQGDMFDEMDALFGRLFARMQEDMFRMDYPPAAGYRIVIENAGYPGQYRAVPDQKHGATPCIEPEVHRIDNEIKVIAGLPGADPASLRLDLRDQILVIEADGPDAPYSAAVNLPDVDSGTLQKTFRNGVLEVTFRLLPAAGANPV